MRVAAIIALLAMATALASPLAIRSAAWNPAQKGGPPCIVTLDTCHQGQPAVGSNGNMAADIDALYVLPVPTGFHRLAVFEPPGPPSRRFPPDVGPPRS